MFWARLQQRGNVPIIELEIWLAAEGAVTAFHGIHVYGVVNPELDADQLVRVLLEIASDWGKPGPEPNADGSYVEDHRAS